MFASIRSYALPVAILIAGTFAGIVVSALVVNNLDWDYAYPLGQGLWFWAFFMSAYPLLTRWREERGHYRANRSGQFAWHALMATLGALTMAFITYLLHQNG